MASPRFHVVQCGEAWAVVDRVQPGGPLFVGDMGVAHTRASMLNAKPAVGLSNGVHVLFRDAYDRIDRHNWSTLKHMGRSPAHYRHNRLAKRPDTAALRMGRAVHVATLEPELFRAQFAVWEGGRRAGKEWEAFKESHQGLDILTEDENAEVQALANAVHADKHASRYVTSGRAEVTVLWTDAATGLDCKARLDFVADVGALADLKTTRDASPEAFGREVVRLGYHVQAAFYSDGYEAATGKHLPYALLAVEKETPHLVQVYRVPEEILELGREEYRALLLRLAECKRAARWPGYADGELDLTLPRWAVPESDEEDLGELELVVGGEAHGF